MMLTKLKWASAAVLVSGLALTGAAVMARQAAKQPGNDSALALNRADAGTDLSAKPAAGEPTVEPDRAALAPAKEKASSIAELRSQLLHAARLEWTAALKEFLSSNAGLERAYQASRRLKTAEEENRDASSDKTAPATTHFERIREIARILPQHQFATAAQLAEVKSFVAEAELGLALASSISPEQPKSPEVAPTPNPQPHRQRQPDRTKGADPAMLVPGTINHSASS